MNATAAKVSSVPITRRSGSIQIAAAARLPKPKASARATVRTVPLGAIAGGPRFGWNWKRQATHSVTPQTISTMTPTTATTGVT